MKFPQIPVGGRFRFQGEKYERTGPLTGRHLASGRSRLIPRSAQVEPISATPRVDTGRDAEQASLSATEARAALGELCADLSNLTDRLDPASAAERLKTGKEDASTELRQPPHLQDATDNLG